MLIELGAAWKRLERGRTFVSVDTGRDPTFPSTLNAALFLSEKGDRANLVWQRPPKQAPSAESEPAKTKSRSPSSSAPTRAGLKGAT